MTPALLALIAKSRITYQVLSVRTNITLGLFDAKTPTDALEIMSKAAGYKSHAAHASTRPELCADLDVRVVQPRFVDAMRGPYTVTGSYFRPDDITDFASRKDAIGYADASGGVFAECWTEVKDRFGTIVCKFVNGVRR